jgi:endonuclease YncB( thermonuclease family)
MLTPVQQFDPLPIPDFTKTVLPATVHKWSDGDTVWLNVAMPFGLTALKDFRLFGIDTPERGHLGWAEAGNLARHFAPAGSLVSVRTFKDPDKYGRYLAVVGNAEGLVVNDELILSGLARIYDGGTRTPWDAPVEAVTRARLVLAA